MHLSLYKKVQLVLSIENTYRYLVLDHVSVCQEKLQCLEKKLMNSYENPQRKCRNITELLC
jgi:hypothetical protein